MKKFIKVISVSSCSDFNYDIDIDRFILWLGDQKKLGATKLDIYSDDGAIELESYYHREESDEEYNTRLLEAERIREIGIKFKEAQDKKEYERLRLKYGMGFGY